MILVGFFLAYLFSYRSLIVCCSITGKTLHFLIACYITEKTYDMVFPIGFLCV